MSLTQNHDVIQAFPSNRTDQPFHECILPGTSGGCEDLLYSERVNATAKLVAVDGVTVANQIMLGITFCEGFYDLLRRPFGGRMFGDTEVKDSAALVFDHEENKQYLQADRRHGEEIDR